MDGLGVLWFAAYKLFESVAIYADDAALTYKCIRINSAYYSENNSALAHSSENANDLYIVTGIPSASIEESHCMASNAGDLFCDFFMAAREYKKLN